MTYSIIQELSLKGNSFFDEGKYEKARLMFEEALTYVPEPKTNWKASSWLYAGIGDCFFYLNDFEKSKNSFFDAANCPEGITNPFVLLRLGQCCFETGDKEKAIDYLLRAYMLDGKKIFDNEDEKYVNLVKKLF